MTFNHLVYFVYKRGRIDIVNDNEPIQILITLELWVKKFKCRAAIIGDIALNTKNVKLLNEQQVGKSVVHYNQRLFMLYVEVRLTNKSFVVIEEQ